MSAVGKIEELPSSSDTVIPSTSCDGDAESGCENEDFDIHHDEPEEPPSNWRQDYANSVGMRLYDK